MTDNNLLEFNADKMRAFAKRDKLLSFAVNDLQKRGHNQEEALEIAFNSYVLSDKTMEEIYEKLDPQR